MAGVLARYQPFLRVCLTVSRSPTGSARHDPISDSRRKPRAHAPSTLLPSPSASQAMLTPEIASGLARSPVSNPQPRALPDYMLWADETRETRCLDTHENAPGPSFSKPSFSRDLWHKALGFSLGIFAGIAPAYTLSLSYRKRRAGSPKPQFGVRRPILIRSCIPTTDTEAKVWRSCDERRSPCLY